MTVLAEEIRELIRLEGPMPVSRYMALCLNHPLLGYYMSRDPFGRAGDFVTAPEISQMFGEMIGVWAVSVWERMGRPPRFCLVELGPGRGTLMADLLRAGRAMPGFRAAADIVLVETSPVLRRVQAQTLAACGPAVRWASSVAELLADAPRIVIANEFFDALPVRQLVFADGGWRERLVGLDGAGALCFGLSGEPIRGAPWPGAHGDVRETCPDGEQLMADLARAISGAGGALITIDYGYARACCGETLQAVAGHAFADPLALPGEADLTAHVDFEALAAAAKSGGGVVMPLLTQGTLLERLGITARTQALAAGAPARAEEIAAARARLIGPGAGQMGTLFKALAIAAPGLGPLPAFDSPDPVLQQILA